MVANVEGWMNRQKIGSLYHTMPKDARVVANADEWMENQIPISRHA